METKRIKLGEFASFIQCAFSQFTCNFFQKICPYPLVLSMVDTCPYYMHISRSVCNCASVVFEGKNIPDLVSVRNGPVCTQFAHNLAAMCFVKWCAEKKHWSDKFVQFITIGPVRFLQDVCFLFCIKSRNISRCFCFQKFYRDTNSCMLVVHPRLLQIH